MRDDTSTQTRGSDGGDRVYGARRSYLHASKEERSMSTESVETRFTIAHRSSDGLEVTLTWEPAAEQHKVVVCVFDEQTSTYLEIPTETYLALDVYYHPLAYRDFGTFHRESSWVAA
jgi:hypothetical protein